MCTVNRISAEPPQHPECSEFAARICPFLLEPRRVRRPGGVADRCPEDETMIPRNPGVVALWTCTTFLVEFGPNERPLARMGEPLKVRWFTEGRPATRQEVIDAFDSGCPTLQAMAEAEGPEAVAAFTSMRDGARRHWPKGAK